MSAWAAGVLACNGGVGTFGIGGVNGFLGNRDGLRRDRREWAQDVPITLSQVALRPLHSQCEAKHNRHYFPRIGR